jgi:hypothetical protein
MDITEGILWGLWGLTVPAYPIVQVIVLLRTSGTVRWVAAFPLLFMIPAYILFVFGMAQGGDNNLSPLFLILPSPVALLYVTLVVLSGFVLPGAKRSTPAAGPPLK